MIEFDTQIMPTARAMSFSFSGRVQLSKCAKIFTLPRGGIDAEDGVVVKYGLADRAHENEFFRYFARSVKAYIDKKGIPA